MRFIISFLVRSCGLGAGFILSILLARTYDKEVVGGFFLFVQLVTLCAMVMRYGSDNSLLKLSQYFSREDKVSVLKLSSQYALRIIIPFLVFLPLINYFWFGNNIEFVLLIIACLLPYSFIQFSGEYLKGIGNQNNGIILQVVLIPVLMLFLVSFFPNRPEILYTICVLICFIASALGWRNYKEPKVFTRGNLLEEYQKGLSAYFYVSVLNVVIATMDTIMIAIVSTADSVAEYNIANKVALISSVVLVVVNGLIGPIFSSLWNEGKQEELVKKFTSITGYMMLIAVAIFTLAVGFGREFLIAFFGSDYESSYTLLVVLSFAQAVVLATGPVAFLLMMTGHTQYHRRSLNIAIACNVTLNLILIPLYGAIGAAWATSISLILKNIYSLAMANRIFKMTDLIFGKVR
ncbi:polysaccharide biosynthesis protein [Ferrimonas balearica DSM 9799]|uniref:Polysaccharide biosynthesis protein n=1 Tax=Ferrimonas balearica (strain DSM 9799 / CCM 4581 / KCTC 23876 / PAT) TaxID=550540 RepID=E1SUU0_FERBD|nr:oligosaccharide flippase family protein [Ferrimonas balearica]ADN75281.1 polysaccharide biosynthesis protein [Ferrimonas balearica DSM 9799]